MPDDQTAVQTWRSLYDTTSSGGHYTLDRREIIHTASTPYTIAQSNIPRPANHESPPTGNPAAAALLATDAPALLLVLALVMTDETAEVTLLTTADDEPLVPDTVTGAPLPSEVAVLVNTVVDPDGPVLVTVTTEGTLDDRMDEMMDATEDAVEVMIV